MGIFSPGLAEMGLSDLIVAAKTKVSDDTPEMGEVIARFEAKARSIASGVCWRANDLDDAANAARYGLVQAVRRHDSARSGFVSYAITTMTGAARRTATAMSDQRLMCVEDSDLRTELDALAHDAHDGDAIINAVEPLAEFEGVLTTKQRDVAHLRFVLDLTMAEIAEVKTVSKSAVSQQVNTIIRDVRAAIVNRGLLGTAA